MPVLTGRRLAELPSVATLVAHHEGGHRLVSGSGLELVVGAVPGLAFAALQQVCLCALNGGLEGYESR